MELRTIILSVSTLLLLLVASQSLCKAGAVDIQPCRVLIIRTKLFFYNITNETAKCCDSWCTSMCPVNVTVTLNSTVYYQDYQCCAGYQGDPCLPVCATPCGLNKHCSQPDQCTCIRGWRGDECQRVDGLTPSGVSSTSIELSWLAPANNNDNGYYILCSSNTQSINKTIESGHNTSNVTSLNPYTIYRCCVIPLLVFGNGTASCMTILTSEAAPSTAPTDVTVQSATNTSLLIQWQPPVVTNGVIQNYTLYINYINGSQIAIRIVDSQFDLYLLSGLVANQRVEVSVSATTKVGEGPLSNYIAAVVDSSILLTTFTPTIDTTLLTVIKSNRVTSLTLLWEPPLSLQHLASYYQLVLTSPQGKYCQWTLGVTQVLNLTLSLEPFVLHELNATVITNTATMGLVSSDIFFVKEGVPKSSPVIQTVSRISPSSGRVDWTPLNLFESRGFVTNYTITYSQSTSNSSCGNIAHSDTLTTSEYSVLLKGLDVQKPYCLTVYASTDAGAGPSSYKYLIPTYESSKFCLLLTGVYNCSRWILDDLNEKLINMTTVLVNVLNDICSCDVNSYNIAQMETKLSCLEELDQAMYCGRLIGTDRVSSLKLIDSLKEWNNRQRLNPIILSGLSLTVADVCNINCTISAVDGEAITTTNYYKVATLILGISLVLLLLFELFTCVLLVNYCNKYYNKNAKDLQYDPNLCMYQSSNDGSRISTDSSELSQSATYYDK